MKQESTAAKYNAFSYHWAD